MFTKKYLFSLVLFGVSASGTELTEIGYPDSPAPAQTYWESSVSLFQYDYSEEVPAPFKSNENGTLQALSTRFRFPIPETRFLEIGLSYGKGGTRYDGSLMSGSGDYLGPAQGDTENVMGRAEVLMGSTVVSGHDADFSLYSGVSFRYWGRNSKSSYGSDEAYHTWSLPLGAQYRQFLGRNFSIGADVSLRWCFSGSMDVDMKDARFAQMTLPLGSRVGAKVSLPVHIWSISDWGIGVSLTPWYELFRIGKGESMPLQSPTGEYFRSRAGNVIGAHEPASSAHVYGADLAVVVPL